MNTVAKCQCCGKDIQEMMPVVVVSLGKPMLGEDGYVPTIGDLDPRVIFHQDCFENVSGRQFKMWVSENDTSTHCFLCGEPIPPSQEFVYLFEASIQTVPFRASTIYAGRSRLVAYGHVDCWVELVGDAFGVTQFARVSPAA